MFEEVGVLVQFIFAFEFCICVYICICKLIDIVDGCQQVRQCPRRLRFWSNLYLSLYLYLYLCHIVDGCQISQCLRRLRFRSNLGEKTKSLQAYGVLLTAWWSEAYHATNIVQDYLEINTNIFQGYFEINTNIIQNYLEINTNEHKASIAHNPY